ncbi:MAG: hypothetical protein ABS911_08985 [Carnobacterium sp.]|uniref:hypothetical protein n=1 Tax=Carnobacterium sp. TaxID=48221 RepID=UPI003314BF7C
MRYMTKIGVVFAVSGCLFGLSTISVSASENVSNNDVLLEESFVTEGQPVIFEDATSIEEVVSQIDNFYENTSNMPSSELGITPMAAAGTKWGNGTVVNAGGGSQLVTSYFWVKGSNMSGSNVVGRAQKKAVTDKYGSVKSSTSYKMKTTQKVNMSPQTQGYVTVSATAWVYARD